MGRLAGRIAIVTGAASGIGAASAKLFADEGAQVLAVDRPESEIGTVHAGNAAIAPFAADIAGDDAPKNIVAEALAKFGALDILFNNAGVGGRARTLALELGKFNITANYVCPGAIYSGMTRTNFDNPEIRTVWEKKAALRRLGQPIDIARGALLLASDEADFITGHELVVDGGLTLRT